MTSLLAIVIDAAKDNSYSWLLAASLPPLFYLLAKKKKPGWLKKLFVKWTIRRVRKQAKKNGKMSEGMVTLLAILIILGLGTLAVLLLGWAWTIIIILLGLLYIGSKRAEQYYE